MKRAVWLASVFVCGLALAQPALESPGDKRIRYVPYKADASVLLTVRRGVVTRIILEKGESIRLAGTGFLSRCEVESDEWCIRAEKNEYQVWVKPKSGATHNNLELQTDKRDYSIKLVVLPDAPRGEAPPDEVFRAIFVYPATDAPPGAISALQGSISGAGFPTVSPAAVGASGNLASLGCAMPRQVVNANYTREATKTELVPQRIFDDGIQTVFAFGDTAPLPAVFAVVDGAEKRVNFSVDGNCLVVHQIGREFVLRAGTNAVRVFNEAYAPGAASPPIRAAREQREVLQ